MEIEYEDAGWQGRQKPTGEDEVNSFIEDEFT